MANHENGEIDYGMIKMWHEAETCFPGIIDNAAKVQEEEGLRLEVRYLRQENEMIRKDLETIRATACVSMGLALVIALFLIIHLLKERKND